MDSEWIKTTRRRALLAATAALGLGVGTTTVAGVADERIRARVRRMLLGDFDLLEDDTARQLGLDSSQRDRLQRALVAAQDELDGRMSAAFFPDLRSSQNYVVDFWRECPALVAVLTPDQKRLWGAIRTTIHRRD